MYFSYDIYFSFVQYVKQVFTSCTDLVKKKQFCYMIARHVSS